MRSHHYSSFAERINVEANHFAMHLLVPDSLLAQEDLSQLDFADDRLLKDLAKKYQTSVAVMLLRIREFLKAQGR